MLRAVLTAFAVISLTGPASAQSVNPADLDRIKRDQAAAKAKADKLEKEQASVRSDITKFKRDLQKTAAESASIEKTSREIAEKLSDLNRDEARLLGSLNADKAALTEVLAALQRIEINPPPALMVGAKNATDAAMAASLMGSLATISGAVLGGVIGQLYDGTALPLAVATAILTGVGGLIMRRMPREGR